MILDNVVVIYKQVYWVILNIIYTTYLPIFYYYHLVYKNYWYNGTKP